MGDDVVRAATTAEQACPIPQPLLAPADLTDELRDMVAAEHNDAIARGVTGVPNVMLNGLFPVQGAQDVETYERLINRVIERGL